MDGGNKDIGLHSSTNIPGSTVIEQDRECVCECVCKERVENSMRERLYDMS